MLQKSIISAFIVLSAWNKMPTIILWENFILDFPN